MKGLLVTLVIVGGIAVLCIHVHHWNETHPTPPPEPVWTVYKYEGLGVEFFQVNSLNKLQKSGDCISGTDISGNQDHMCGDYTIEKGESCDVTGDCWPCRASPTSSGPISTETP